MMLQFSRLGDQNDVVTRSVTLRYEQRQKSRLRVTLDDGEVAGIVLEHGQRLRHNDILRTSDGVCAQVRAAPEQVTTVSSDHPLALLRAAYHLGNRHVPLQIGERWVRYERDHVLDGMIDSLGLSPLHESTPFEPEQGAYAAHSHAKHAGHSAHHDHSEA